MTGKLTGDRKCGMENLTNLSCDHMGAKWQDQIADGNF